MDKIMKFELRGDEKEMIDAIKDYIPSEREDIWSWICYFQNELPIEQDLKNTYEPSIAIPPADTLLELLADKNMSLQKLSELSGLEIEVLQGVINASTSIDNNIAMKLEEVLGVSTRFWLNLEKNYQLSLWRINRER